ncbi:MAG: KH domain-containing protein [Ruminococcaceae bacterium]|nr:KH domain-containing protein [Oscillospiraceae bacterium]
MNIEAEIAVTEGGKGEVRIAISGERAAVLIGHHGETLDFLQYLANPAANKRIDGKKEEYTKVSVDAEGYRLHRIGK